MHPLPRPVSIDDLLANAGWVRALARSLVRDPHAADDVEQQAWTAAIGRPPGRRGNLRAWFARVVRRKASDVRRGAERRRRHETAVPAREDLASPGELVARAELRAQLAKAVLALAEPYRATVLLRYFEGLEAAEIAELQAVPLATVRTRLQRAITLLRERLRKAWGGEPRDARARLLTLAGGGWGAVARGGAIVITKKTGVGVLAAGLLLLTGGAWWLLSEPRGHADHGSGSMLAERASEESEPSLVGRAGSTAKARDEVDPEAKARAAGLLVYPALVRAPARLAGRVWDAQGAPAAGAEVEAHSSPGAQYPVLRIGDDRGHVRTVAADAEGRFAVEALTEGPYWVRAKRGAEGTPWRLAVARGAPLDIDLTFGARSEGGSLAVRVVDAGGSAVAGATVEAEGTSQGRVPIEPDRIRARRSGTTDASGRIVWADFDLAHGFVSARTPAGLVGTRVLFNRGRRYGGGATGEVEVVVAETGLITGRVAATGGEPLLGAAVVARASGWYPYCTEISPAWRAPVVEGAYELVGLPSGPYDLLVEGGGWSTVVEWHEEERRNVKSRTAEVPAGGVARFDLDVIRGAVIEGKVVGPGGRVPGAWIRVVRTRTPGDETSSWLAGAHVWRLDAWHGVLYESAISHRTVRPGDAAAYRVDGLVPGTYRVEIGAPGFTYVQHVEQPVALDQPLRIDATLTRAGVLQGAAPGKSYLGVRPVGSVPCVALAILPGPGQFTFPGLAPGEHEIVNVHWGTEPVVLARARIEAGRTTWIDLPNAGEHGLSGRVVLAGEPVAGALVRRGGHEESGMRTGADGRFDVRWERATFNPEGALHVALSLGNGESRSWEFRGLPVSGGVIEFGDLELGREQLTIDVVDAHGRGTEALVEVASPRTGRMGAGRRGAGAAARERDETREPTVRAGLVRRTDARGRLVVDGLRPGETYEVAARLPGVDGPWPGVTLPLAEPVRLTLPPTVRLVVTVRDARGEAVEGAHISGRIFPNRTELLPPPGGKDWHGSDGPGPSGLSHREMLERTGSFSLSGRTDAAGRLELPAVPAGAAYLDAFLDTPRDPRPRASTAILLRLADPHEVELRFP
jgi:RNA polymerase sigma factor (sigma-70 family)